MHALITLAYNSTEPTVLLNLLSKIKEQKTDVRSSLPHAEGLLLRQVSLLKTSRKIKQKINTNTWWTQLLPIPHWNQQVKEGESDTIGNCSVFGIKAVKLRESASNAPPLALQTTPSTLSVAKPALTTGNMKVLNTDRRCTQGG